MSHDTRTPNPYGLPTGKLSKAKMEELDHIREAILANARRKVDPEGVGFDAMMQSSDDGGIFGDTGDPEFQDWLHWAEDMVSVISLVSQRVSLAIASAGFAIAGATMVGTERAAGLGRVSLGLAGVFVVWFVFTNLIGARGQRPQR